MAPQTKFHLVFSFIMGFLMISLMTLVITAVNVGFVPDFLTRWGKAFMVAYIVGVPVIFVMAPMARKLTAKLLGVAP